MLLFLTILLYVRALLGFLGSISTVCCLGAALAAFVCACFAALFAVAAIIHIAIRVFTVITVMEIAMGVTSLACCFMFVTILMVSCVIRTVLCMTINVVDIVNVFFRRVFIISARFILALLESNQADAILSFASLILSATTGLWVFNHLNSFYITALILSNQRRKIFH